MESIGMKLWLECLTSNHSHLLCGIFMVNVPTWENQYGRVTLESDSELFGTFYTEINSLILNG